MKHILSLTALLGILASTAFAQVQIDRSIDLNSSTPANARVMGIKQVSAAQDAVSAEVHQKGGLTHATVTGGPNAYTLTFTPAITTPYSEGMTVSFKATADNTGAVTLNGIAVRKDVSTALTAGDIKSGQLIHVSFDGTNFQLISRTTDANSGGTVTSVSTAAANNGVTATWANATTTPALTIGLGAITPSSVAATGTVTGSNLSGVNTGDQTLSGLGGVPTSRTITINGTAQDLTANRSWSVGTVTGTGTQNYVTKWNNAGGTAIGNSLIYDNGTAVGIGTTSLNARLDIATANLATSANSVVEMLRLSGNNGNASMLDVRHIRTSAGSDWTFAGTRIQQKIDATWMGYVQFNGDGNNGGISFGTGTTTAAPGNVGERMRIASNGTVTISNLAGTGNAPVMAASNGTLYRQQGGFVMKDFKTAITANIGPWGTGTGTTVVGGVNGTYVALASVNVSVGSTSDQILVHVSGYSDQAGSNDDMVVRYYVSEGTNTSETLVSGIHGDSSVGGALVNGSFVLAPAATGTRTITVYGRRGNSAGGNTYVRNLRVIAQVIGQ